MEDKKLHNLIQNILNDYITKNKVDDFLKLINDYALCEGLASQLNPSSFKYCIMSVNKSNTIK